MAATCAIDPNVAVQIFSAMLAFLTGIGVWFLESRRQEGLARREAELAKSNFRKTLIFSVDQTMQQLRLLSVSLAGKKAEVERCSEETSEALANSIRDLADQAFVGVPTILSPTEAHAKFFSVQELQEISDLAFELTNLNHRLEVLRRDVATSVSVSLINEHLDAVGRMANLAQDKGSALLGVVSGAMTADARSVSLSS